MLDPSKRLQRAQLARQEEQGRLVRLTDPILEDVADLHPFAPDTDAILADVVLADLAALARVARGRVDVLEAKEGRDDSLGRVFAGVAGAGRVRAKVDDDRRDCPKGVMGERRLALERREEQGQLSQKGEGGRLAGDGPSSTGGGGEGVRRAWYQERRQSRRAESESTVTDLLRR